MLSIPLKNRFCNLNRFKNVNGSEENVLSMMTEVIARRNEIYYSNIIALIIILFFDKLPGGFLENSGFMV